MEQLDNKRLAKELDSFQKIWKGGYYEGDVLSELSFSTYGRSGFMSILYATYLKCIKPYINDKTIVLEIGPGRGTWTKTMLDAEKIIVIDALSAEHNKFWEYIGEQAKIDYFQVSDFSCKELPDNFFNYMFSFGCLCHVSYDGIVEYAKNLYPKLKSGCNCFWMIADYDKYNALLEKENDLDLLMQLLKSKRIFRPLYNYYVHKRKVNKVKHLDKNENDIPAPGRWYHCGTERCCEMLRSNGYRIIEMDTGTTHRDPIIHFTKD